ncbi:MAG TPA: MBG domain-containing protein, partial [Rhizomicrobium sp.]
VAGLLATTSDINDQDFLSGRYSFSSTGGKGAITNAGTITAGKGGSVVLSAPNVTNKGLIQAKAGHVVLGGTDTFTVDFNGDHLLNYAISPNSSGGKVSNSGKVAAAGGTILMTARAAAGVQDAVINNSGMVEATSVRQENGEIILEADNGTVSDTGTLDASGKAAGETGGTVKVLGQQVAVADGAKIDVSGDAGGGTALIGGNLHGAGPEPNAQNTTVGKASINASAVTKGNGGTVAVYSTGTTHVAATITAKGGITSGKGGMVETSGHTLSVADSTMVNTLAPHGTPGDWLLDPDNITIATGGAGSASGETFAVTGNVTIDPNTIATALASTSVTLQANQNIVVNNAVSAISSAQTLELDAGGSITLNAGLQVSSGSIILSAGNPSASGGSLAGAAISQIAGASIVASSLSVSNQALGGTISLTAAGNNFTNLSVTTNGGSATINTSGSVAVTGANLTSSGDFSLTAGGAITQTGAILAANNLTVTATTGDITLTNAANAITGSVNLSVLAGTTGASFTSSINTIIGNIDIQTGGLTVSTSGAIALTGIVSVTGSGQPVSFSAGGSIGQSSGEITVSSATGFKAFASGTNTSLASSNNNISVPVSLYGQNITFANSTAITLSSVNLDGINPASSVAILSSGGSISQTGAILATNLSATTQAASGGTITLNNGGNAITGIARFMTANGDVTFNNQGSVTLGNSSIVGNLTVSVSNGQLLIADPVTPGGMVQASGNISLSADYDVVQGTSYSTGSPLSLVPTSRIPLQPGVGNNLSVSSAFGDIELDATNVVTGRLSLFSTGNISFTNQYGITVGVGEGFSSGVATTGSIGNGSVPSTVSLTSVDGNLDLENTITATGAVTLKAGSGIIQAAGGTITAGTLSATTAAGDITLTDASNQISGIIDMQAPGNISLVNSVNTYVDTIGNGLVPIGGIYSAPAAATSVTISAPNIYPNTGGGYGIAASSISLTTPGGFIGCANIDVCSSMLIQPLQISGGFAGSSPDSAAASLSISTNGGDVYLLSRSPVTIAGSGINLNYSISGYPGGALHLFSYGGVNVYGPVSTSGNVIDIDSGGTIQVNMPISAALIGSGPGTIVLTANDHNLNTLDAGVSFNNSSNGIAGLSTLTAGAINLTADFGLANGQGGDIGSQAQPLQVASDTGSLSLAVRTYDGNAYITSPVGVSIDDQSSVLAQFGTFGPPLTFGANPISQFGINTAGNNGIYGQMSLTAAGPISQTYGIQSGTLTLTATGPTGSINLTDPAQSPDPGNQVFGTVHLNSSSDVNFATNLIITNLGASSVGGNLTVVATAGDLSIADPNGGAVNVTGTTTLTAGTGYGISILSPLISGSNIVLLADHDIIQEVTGSTDVHIQTGGTLSASSSTGSISLMDLGDSCSGSGCTVDVGNQVAGSVQLDAVGGVAFANVPGVTIASGATLGQFLVETPGNITIAPGGAIKAGGSAGSTSSVGSAGGTSSVGSVGSSSSGGSVGSPSSAGPTSTAAIVLVAGGSFINNSGLGQSTLLPASGGVFNIYSQSPTGDTFGGLNSNNQAIWGTTYAAPPTVSGDRYIFAYQPTLTVAVSGSASKVYGGDDTSTVAQIGYSITGLQPGLAGVYLADTAASIYGTVTTVSDGAAANANVGSYAITVSNLNVSDGYALSVQGGTLTITPATLTYLADAQGRYAGQPNSAFSGVVTGFVNGDTQSSATTGTLVFSSTATAATPAGSYAIDGSGLSATNYVFVQAAGNATALTVVTPPITGATPVLTGFTAAIQPPVLNPASTPLAAFQFNPITLPVVPPPPLPPLTAAPPPVLSPLADNNAEQPTSSDQTTSQVADSLDGDNSPHTGNGNGQHGGGIVIPGMLIASHTLPPPPTDISALSSFGNSSLWQ